VVKEEQPMKSIQRVIAAAVVLALSGCETIENIFEAGMWTGVIAVLVVVGVVAFLISKMRR
jgi:hypothetical protein